MSILETAQDIPLDRYATWTDGEHIAVNVATIYRELCEESRVSQGNKESSENQPPGVVAHFSMMAALYARG